MSDHKMSMDQPDHASAPYRHEITISVGGDSEDQIQIKTPSGGASTPTPSPRSMQSSHTTDEISTNSMTDDDNAVLAPKQKLNKANGVDNLAFENDNKTSQQRPMSSFGQNGNGQTNGKSATDKPLAEAVNLELVNLNKASATNGHRENGFTPKKKDTQVEIPNDGYEEYFVPVNEHKKYMRDKDRSSRGVDQYGHSLNEPVRGVVDYNSWRKVARGEKLYISKDKRLKSNWRKRLIWAIGLTLCAAILIIAILAATGVIGSEPEPIESRQFSDKENQINSAGIFGTGSKRRQNATQYSSTPQPPGSTVPPHPPTTEEYGIEYVPNSLNGKLKIENMEFLDEYNDHNSPIYTTIAREIELGIKESLQDYKNVNIKVLNLTKGSIVVDYRATWDDEEDLSDEIMMESMTKYLKENHGYLYSYFVPTDTLSYTKVIDKCAMHPEEMHCEHGCKFDRTLAVDFVCVTAVPEPSSPEPEIVKESKSDLTSEPKSEPEPSSEPKSEKESSSEPKSEPEPSSEPKSEKESSSEPTSEPEATSEPKSEPEPSSEPKSEKESSSEPKSEKESSSEPTSEPEATSEPKSEPEPASEPKSSSEHSLTHENVQAEPEPTSEPEPSSAEPTSDSNKRNKNGKELMYDPTGSHMHEEEIEAATILPSSDATEMASESSTRKQKYTYDFDPSESDKEEHHVHEEEITKTVVSPVHSEHSHEHSEKSIELPVHTVIQSSTSEQPAPVTEDLSDDTPMPTENYFKAAKSVEHRTELNVMDTTTPSTSKTTPETTIYSTTAPIKIDYEESSSARSTQASSSSQKPMYAVTENIEQDTIVPSNVGPIDQSPFLPENENGETFLNILHPSHEVDAIQNETVDDIKPKKVEVVEEEDDHDSDTALLEPENENINLISGPVTHLEKTVDAEIDASEEKTEVPSDSTEIYHLEESRTHNHDKTEEPREVSKQSSTESGETLVMDHLEHSEVPTKVLPIAADVQETTETEHITEIPEISTEPLISQSLPIESTSAETVPSSSSTTSLEPVSEESTEADIDSTTVIEEATPVQIKSLEKNIEASEIAGSTTTPKENATVNELPQATSEQIATSSEHVASSTTELLISPSSTESSSESSSTTTTASPLVNDISNESEEPSNEIKYQKLTEQELKVIPLTTTTTSTTQRPNDPDDPNDTSTEAETVTAEEETESTTGHFLSNATFRLSNESIETSLNSSDSIGNDLGANNSENVNQLGGENEKEDMQTHRKVDIIEGDSTLSSTVKADHTYSRYSRCTAGQFECKNGTSIKDGGACISLSERCDSIAHCSDNSDEADCEATGCPGHFQCNDGTCLARSLVCDKIVHCTDGSDEASDLCSAWKCEFDEIACSENGPCLPAILQCDGIQHCANQADETNCPDNCKANEFYCSWQKKCIPESWLCDGEVDCSGGEDELQGCGNCPPEHFKCNTGRCIPDHYICDGQPQCADLSDDWDCFNLTKVPQSLNLSRNDNQTDHIGIDSSDEKSAEMTALRIRQTNGEYAFVCSDTWNLHHSDMICEKMGFARSSAYSHIQINDDDAIFVKINPDLRRATQFDKLVQAFNQTDECHDNRIVQLECEPFATANNVTRDPNAAAHAKQWPTLALAISGNSNVRCSATTVAPRWVLSSYSCIFGRIESIGEVKDSLSWSIQFNAIGDSSADEPSTNVQQINVVRIYKYPQTKFKHLLYSGDAVLLELESSFESDGSIAAILTDEPIDSENEKCITAGWIPDIDHNQTTSFELKQNIDEFALPPLNNDKCNSTDYYAGSLPIDSICAESDRIDSDNSTMCYNDEGAPLICYSPKTSEWRVKGILSYHGECKRHAQPTVYTKITAPLLHWIAKTVGNDHMIRRSTS